MHDGVTKRNKMNPSKLAGGANPAEQKNNQGLFGEAQGMTENEQRDLMTDRRPIRIKDVATNMYQ